VIQTDGADTFGHHALETGGRRPHGSRPEGGGFQRVGAGATCPARTWDHLVELAEARIDKYRLFTGHFDWGFEDVIGRPLRVFTLFRNPLERTISHYRHVHRDESHPRHKVVQWQTFDEFVADVDNRPMIENFQARYLVHNVIDPMLLWRRFDGDMTKRNRLSTASEDCRYLFDKSYVREAANRHFQDLDVVGVTSEVDSFLARVASRRGSGFSMRGLSRRRRTPRRQTTPALPSMIGPWRS
jgi:hypothetical protein